MKSNLVSINNSQETPPEVATFSVSQRLAQMRDRMLAIEDSRLGIAYLEKDGRAELIFSSLDRKELVAVPTRISQEEYNKITCKMIDLPETQFILHELAKAYDQRTAIMFEGGTAIGKTYAVNKFSQLIYGPIAVIPDFYCTGQTDVSELMGKYVPAGLDPKQLKDLNDFLQSKKGLAMKEELMEQGGGQYDMRELYSRAYVALGFPLHEQSFKFQLGILPKALTANFDSHGRLEYVNDGPGVMMHVQEAGLAAPSVILGLLKTRGERGGFAPEIQIWEDGGRAIKVGSGFFMVYSTNPPEGEYQERFAIDAALARSVVWVTLPEKLSDNSLRKASTEIFSFKDIPARGSTILDLAKSPELAQMLGEVVVKFHKAYVELTGKGETGRSQKIPASIDSIWKVASLCQCVQVLTEDGSAPDFTETVKCAIKGIYINSLKSKPPIVPGSGLNSAGTLGYGEELINALDMMLNDEKTALIDFRGEAKLPSEILLKLTAEAMAKEGEIVSDGTLSEDTQDALNEKYDADIDVYLEQIGDKGIDPAIMGNLRAVIGRNKKAAAASASSRQQSGDLRELADAVILDSDQ